MTSGSSMFHRARGGLVADSAPVGTVTRSKVSPKGNKWLECDGSSIDPSVYPELEPALLAIGLTPDGVTGLIPLPSPTTLKLVDEGKLYIKALP